MAKVKSQKLKLKCLVWLGFRPLPCPNYLGGCYNSAIPLVVGAGLPIDISDN
ncbi:MULTISPECIES: hypothetical protein [unclassified Nodularia (in: cyanobacteria)]|uniref:hypothetical protein n=1 Tax=unclassified Nodularia (in: cyanobacteria) TaxID=2656917 RepID=UPI001882641D|nr:MULTISPECIES: hypothetical protein [unclassified Nodularia (in: cyanobacteria)]MBE9200808.1 hypothetical protein [Nodularia sp. LEGE 06071]MCC2693810.1 hypothetical protein [Nodularia sp. LEGE 04288]